MKVIGIVLAGGKSSRFGSDKAISMFQGKTMLKHSVDLMKQFSDRVLISGDKEEYNIYGYPCVPDIYKGIGPMGGICSCLKESDAPLNIIVTCDMPLVTSDMIARLVESHEFGKATVFEDYDGYIYPFPVIFEKGHLSALEQQINAGNCDLKSALKACGTTKILLKKEEVGCMANVNSKDELVRLEKSQLL